MVAGTHKEERKRLRGGRGPGVGGGGGGSGAPPEGQPLQAGTFAVPGERKDDFRPRMQENWIL